MGGDGVIWGEGWRLDLFMVLLLSIGTIDIGFARIEPVALVGTYYDWLDLKVIKSCIAF
ncbi:hypothetical protein K501DRAFT_283244 [Backusella circina FSU 941]|nr:hypothetical protein K501DRAFT_288312 [Backusella circina FSU 941]KAI8887617.1 hypothetical protein K501DRAFT_283229 [Backusella circina FSU 941]KAI8887619.1 hypothetical protein K501DRAFT_283230 [Backusella circina FSU 941]KAI8887642.1 hypothetical protein K501DRAFT_283244 [Backusella circina FSU 941]